VRKFNGLLKEKLLVLDRDSLMIELLHRVVLQSGLATQNHPFSIFTCKIRACLPRES
jgi:hypothetical protein